jgi:hypothetical protein
VLPKALAEAGVELRGAEAIYVYGINKAYQLDE